MPSEVSIHAPARGATWQRPTPEDFHNVSIHAPARGATATCGKSRAALSFNSRAREGRDLNTVMDMREHRFQFTRPRGARRIAAREHKPKGKFQFTRPRGARHEPARLLFNLRHSFNSRAREGRDRGHRSPRRGIQFQFTRPRGARLLPIPGRRSCSRFNSRAREGRDGVGHGFQRVEPVSIHAPARGATGMVGV